MPYDHFLVGERCDCRCWNSSKCGFAMTTPVSKAGAVLLRAVQLDTAGDAGCRKWHASQRAELLPAVQPTSVKGRYAPAGMP